ncbi:multiple sugar transport system permease protein [Kaistia soli DSM 19436]|uniref:Multiple sugar transport system permease protein n=1 Tax=Kaistia soli DSM 19436 TaxID=1122133 RepID=A0A1M5FW23_9HYPH|nr:sugar ABC transporter permease [Kaistia soli]SHF95735.1 multiple sugar transport system permease protein [Kaistia soli DSM 19436]
MSTETLTAGRHRRAPLWGGRFQELGMLLPSLALIAAFLLLPFLSSFRIALTNERLIPRPVPARFVGLDNFQKVLTDHDFWQALWNVARFTVMVLPVQCGFALAIALLLNQKLPFRNFFRGLFFLPAITSMVVVCVIWATLFQYPTGPFNQILGVVSFGMAQPIDWLGDPAWSMPAIVLLSAWQAYGFQMIVYLAGLQGISDSLYEAASLDGANRWQKFWHVTMPSLRQTHVFVLIITTIQAFKLFTQVNILTQGGPRGTTETLVHYMFSAGFVNQRLGLASAVAIILFFIVLAVSLVQRLVVRDRK